MDDGTARVIGLLDDEYPSLLRFSPSPPLALWVRGQIQALDAIAIALLGSSNCDENGATLAGQFATRLAESGVTIVNGGELGIDAAAIGAAMDAGGRAIVALGAGIEAHGRRQLAGMYQRLTNGREAAGALLSTVPLQTPPDPINQVVGDELVGHLSLACCVIRSRRNGGAMIAARIAGEAGRPVLAVPGEPDDADVQGCLHLLDQRRASLAFHPDQALTAAEETVQRLTLHHARRRWLQPNFVAEHPLGPSSREDRRLVSVLQHAEQPMAVIDLADQAELQVRDAVQRLTRLRLMGYVRFDHQTRRYVPATG
ncbi:MAG: DNA-processing protein DprA [Planctomycetota bacterium]